MNNAKTTPTSTTVKTESAAAANTKPAASAELSDQQLDKVSGGVIRRGGDDDLDDLEVER
jgi:hypothetical protein